MIKFFFIFVGVSILSSASSARASSSSEWIQALDGARVEVVHHDLVSGRTGEVVHYIESGPASEGATFVLLHGFPEFWFGWRNQIVALAKAGHRVLAPDLRGFNLSSKPESRSAYRVPDVAALLVEWAQKVAPRQRLIWVGHDWGGAVSWHVATQAPELLDHLVIANMPYPDQALKMLQNPKQYPKQAQQGWYMKLLRSGCAAELIVTTLGYDFIYRKFMLEGVSHSGALLASDQPLYVEAYKRAGRMTSMFNYYRVMLEPENLSIGPWRVNVPVTSIYGMQDRAQDAEVIVKEFKNYVPSATLIPIYSGGHFVQHDAPKIVSQVLLDLAK